MVPILLFLLLNWLQWLLKTMELDKSCLWNDIAWFKQYMFPQTVDISIHIVARYPEGYNPLLSADLQRDLDQMSPQEFVNYIRNPDKLSPEQRQSLMIDERQRRRTFLAQWPHNLPGRDNLSGIRMAQAGFYYLGDSDVVHCAFCRGRLHRWEMDDDPMQEHKNHFPFCRFAQELPCENREFRTTLGQDDLRGITSFDSELRQLANLDPSAASARLGINSTSADNSLYAPLASRNRTFVRWPFNSRMSAARLCEAGFYYTGNEDLVRCFFCGGGLREWSSRDDPWEMHARWFPHCPFLRNEKGHDYVNTIRDKTPVGRKCRMSDHDEMIDFCLKLNHQRGTINRAISNNGGPFENISQMIDSIYDLEEDNDAGQLLDNEGQNPHQLQQTPQTDTTAVQCSDHTIQPPEDEDPLRCKGKECKGGRAEHIGLPCGHLIYCNTCSIGEKQKSQNNSYIPLCPYRGCGKRLTGSFKIYFA